MSVIFPKWMNLFPTLSAIGVIGAGTMVIGGFWYYATPKFWNVGYQPTQPGGGFNHQIHAGKLGLDCRYCHTKVEQSYEANIPNVATCYGCHAEDRLTLYAESEVHKSKTEFIRTSHAADATIPWRRIHRVPDYVHNFPHQVHLNAGVSCFSCHGRIDQMPVVYQAEALSMSWCLDCHRKPELRIRDSKDVYNLDSETLAAQGRLEEALARVHDWKIKPPQSCSGCHR